MKDKYYTIYEVAKMLRVHHRTVSSLIRRKKLMAVNVGTDKRALWRIFEGQYLKFIADTYGDDNETP